MKLLWMLVWLGISAASLSASERSVFEPVPEPSSGVMAVVGACAVGIGVAGRMRRRSQ